MKLSTGKVAFPIEFDNGDKAVIYFNPNDRGIQERIKGFEASVEKRIKEIDLEKYKSRFDDGKSFNFDLENPDKIIDALLEMPSEDLASLQDKLDAINEIENEYNDKTKEELNYVFGDNISDVVFKYCQPFHMIPVTDENGVVQKDADGEDKKEPYIMLFIRWLAIEMGKYGAKNKSAMDKHIAKYSK